MIIRKVACEGWPREEVREGYLTREWLVTNGLGGYASSTIVGVATRRYHGLLVAALPAPHGRTMMLNHLSELVRLPDGATVRFGGWERSGASLEWTAEHLTEFRLEDGLPVWRFDIGPIAIEKRVVMPHRQNTVYVMYRLLSGKGPLRLKIRPALNFRGHDAHVSEPLKPPYQVMACADRYEIKDDSQLPALKMNLFGKDAAFTYEQSVVGELLYRIEESRGYVAKGELWIPGYFRAELGKDEDVALAASTESWESILALSCPEALEAERTRRRGLIARAHPAAQEGTAAELVLAADQFIITPAGRVEDAARGHAEGGEARTVIAGYHWFTDWGRDTMISLEGLTLATGRALEASWILKTFAHHVADGLIPNMFPEGEKDGLYHTADATLWFFHAVDRYVRTTGDRDLLRSLFPKLVEIAERHVAGTRFGIGIDEKDGLLRQGAEGYQLTWMDAKMGDWVVTPRRGKAVEINALWYNALRLLAEWSKDLGSPADAERWTRRAQRTRRSFNERFWYEAGRHLFDVIDGESGDDPALRPNQILAVSLTHPVVDPSRWEAVVSAVERSLLTPVGLRSLAPDHPDYQPKYFGDLAKRDAAYHQGTVWGWLIGPFVDAWRKVHPGDVEGARKLLAGSMRHLGEACIGSMSEIFDATEPFAPRGCVAQAWSVAEVLRAWVSLEAQKA
jgi:predicted glycogen debranching enzyme